MRQGKWALMALAVAGLVSTGAWAAPIAPTQSGKVEGISEDGLAVYKGVPFAAPPIGDLRWKPPQPPESWKGIRPAKAFAPACMQAQRPGSAGPKPSEDCLYLNIWTPAKAPGEKLPVMVWIHGGGFYAGSPSQTVFWGDHLAKKGVVVVNIAYRLGPFGFLAYPGLTAESPHHASGDYGLMDQIAALKWVKRNIAGFGGDPAKVTIFGESAGSMSVDDLTLSPLARGLFRAAIGESGGSYNPRLTRLADAEKAGEAYAKSLGAQSVAELRALPAQKLLDSKAASSVGWPIVDGYVIPAAPVKIISAGHQIDVPVLIGSNAHEGRLFTMGEKTSREDFIKSVDKTYGSFAKKILKLYPAKTEAEAKNSRSELAGDTGLGWSMWRWANLQSEHGHSKVHYYFFEHAPPPTPGVGYTKLGATHFAEVPYVFENPGKAPWTAYDRKLSDEMSSYWTNFAKTLDPNGPGLPKWPAYTASVEKVLHFGDKVYVGGVPYQRRFKLLDAYFAAKRVKAATH